MSEKTKIPYADHSWSPWQGCSEWAKPTSDRSPGCAHCYAESLANRFGRSMKPTFTRDWRAPERWNREPWVCDTCGASYAEKPFACCGTSEFHRARVFVSLCDWLDPEVPIEWLARFLDLVCRTPNLDWLLLSKNLDQWRRRMRGVALLFSKQVISMSNPLNWLYSWAGGVVPHNVWVGTTVEDQAHSNRVCDLLKIPAKVRWLSLEPLLGPIELYGHWGMKPDWVVVGGESGPKARPCNVDWIREIVRQCKSAAVPVFVKQLGSFCVTDEASPDGWPPGTELIQGCPEERLVKLKHSKGSDPAEWPADLRVREFPT